MNPDFQTDTAHPQGLPDIILSINHEFLRQHMQYLLVRRYAHGSRGFDHTIDIGLRDFFLFDCHHAGGVEASNMAACNAGPDSRNLAVRH